jgi:hypothetical protein
MSFDSIGQEDEDVAALLIAENVITERVKGKPNVGE